MQCSPKEISAINLNEWLRSNINIPLIIDVREDQELEIAKLSTSFIHIPISKVSIEFVASQLSPHKKTSIVILCHMGVRSYHFAEWLIANNLADDVYNLKEGIDGWSKYIDASISRY